MQVKNLCRLFRPDDLNVARDGRHASQHKMNEYGRNLDIVAEREERLLRESRFLREEAIRNREDRLRREYIGNVDAGHVAFDPYALSLHTRKPDPVAFYDPVPVMSGREKLLQYCVERDPVPLVSSDLLDDQPLDSNGTVYQRRMEMDMRQHNPQYDIYQQRLETDMRQRNPQYDIYQQRLETDMMFTNREWI